MSKTTITISAIACCLIFAADCTADLLIDIDIAVASVKNKETEPDSKQSQLQLRLGKHYLNIVESDLELICDFGKHRMYWINRAKNYYRILLFTQQSVVGNVNLKTVSISGTS